MTGAPPPAWAAERATDRDRAARLVTAVAPRLAGRPVTLLGEGWDNTVHLVDGEWVFRFPRRAMALPGLRREIAVLPRIAGRLPLPVPAPVVVADDDEPDPWPYTGARLLPGRELADTALADHERATLAGQVGTFLRALHDPATPDAVAGVDLPVDPMARATPVARIEQTRASLDRLVADGVWAGDPAVGELLTEAARLGAPGGTPVLVHGDLHARHVLVGDDGTAAGVIDWGDVCLADPAVDLSLAYAAFAGAARQAFAGAYGPVDGERELRARALAVRLSALLAGYAAADRRPALLAEALAGLGRAVG